MDRGRGSDNENLFPKSKTLMLKGDVSRLRKKALSKRLAPITLFCLLSLYIGAAGGGLPGQEAGQDATLLTISPDAALPESEVRLSVYLKSAQGVKVGSIAMEINFPKRLLSFIKSERSYLSEALGANISAEVVDAEDEDKSKLKLEISAPAGKGGPKAIPDGPIAYIVFKISKDAQPNTEIVLENKAKAMTAEDSPKPVKPIVADNGKISVVPEIITSCFFYMH